MRDATDRSGVVTGMPAIDGVGTAATSRDAACAADLLRGARLRASLTQVQLAARAGVTQSVISTYENGRREPSFAVLNRLLVAAGFEPEIVLRPRREPMSLRERVDERREELVAAVARHGGRNVRLVGGVARGDEPPGCDVDLLVDLAEGVGLFALMAMQDDAEAILGARVDVVSAESVPASTLAAVQRDAVVLS